MNNKLLLIVVSLLSLFPGVFLLFGTDVGVASVGLGLLLLPAIFVFIQIRNKGFSNKYFLLLLLNPILFIPIASFTKATVSYFIGSPSLSYCGEPYGRYHPEYRMKVEMNHCDFPLIDVVTDGIKNNSSITLFHLFGYAKDSYIAELPGKHEISPAFFKEGQTILSFDEKSSSLLLDNGESIPIDPLSVLFKFRNRRPSAIFKFKSVNPDLFVLGTFVDSIGMMEADVYLIPKQRFIHFYTYIDNWEL